MPIFKGKGGDQEGSQAIMKEGKPSLATALSVARRTRAKGAPAVPSHKHLGDQEHAVAAMGEHPKSLVEAIRERQRLAKGGEVEPDDELPVLPEEEPADDALPEVDAPEEEPKSLIDRIRAKQKAR